MRPEEKFIELHNKIVEKIKDPTLSEMQAEIERVENNYQDEWNKWFEENQRPALHFKDYIFNYDVCCFGWNFAEVEFSHCKINKMLFSGCGFDKGIDFYKCDVVDIEFDLCSVK